ncbi:MBOAT family O-acyltransferase [Methylocaldum sp.]|jgi:alginate O-acetyltransferase complex protein AlgI|uniref:MBOAT family O-acyltransferase n=1 Tax=unclassified Methylocaldum TaxID=2622260 RepID=UPI0032200160
MLFNSYPFIFLLLPISLFVFFAIGSRGHHRVAIAWLIGVSLFFYAWWNPAYLGLLLASILFNYALGVSLSGEGHSSEKKWLLIFGIAANLSLLGYYKYANFFVDNINFIFGDILGVETIILPLGISFITFQTIAYLVDAYKGETKEYNFLHFCLFVTFFPQLIAGPIVHHREMMPQFARNDLYQLSVRRHAVGFTIFTIGLFKKVVLADGVAAYATPAFHAADSGIALTFFEAWAGALAYTLQLYFDFSGYSDMAIGLARMFGIRLPLNFNSPYKSTNIIDFWRRWHITLSRFMRDYIYIPLGGNRKGPTRRHANLMIAMLLGGLWHGAGWNFVVWGGLHGFFLIVNHVWRSLFGGRAAASRMGKAFGWTLTFVAVIAAWVPFRAETITGTKSIWLGMIGANGVSLEPEALRVLGRFGEWLQGLGVTFDGVFAHVAGAKPEMAGAWLLALSIFVLFLPNTQQLMRNYHPAFETYKGEIQRLRWRWMEWRPTVIWANLTMLLFVFDVLSLTKVSEFLYFQF